MNTPEYLTVAECAARLRVSPSLVRQHFPDFSPVVC